MQRDVEKLTGEPLSVDQLIEYLPALKEVARAQLDNWAKGAAPKIKIEKKKATAYKANACDLCTQLSTPGCVYACPHDAAKRVGLRRFFGGAMKRKRPFSRRLHCPRINRRSILPSSSCPVLSAREGFLQQ